MKHEGCWRCGSQPKVWFGKATPRTRSEGHHTQCPQCELGIYSGLTAEGALRCWDKYMREVRHEEQARQAVEHVDPRNWRAIDRELLDILGRTRVQGSVSLVDELKALLRRVAQ